MNFGKHNVYWHPDAREYFFEKPWPTWKLALFFLGFMAIMLASGLQPLP